MVMTDPIADLLTRIRNANHMRHEKVEIPASKLKADILEVLKKEGYIINYSLDETDKFNKLVVTLKYTSTILANNMLLRLLIYATVSLREQGRTI